MKLEIFEFIDDTLNMIEDKEDYITEAADILEAFFTDSFYENDDFLNVNYRIKSSESLKEKILSHNFYIKYKTPDNLINNLSDLIGVRIECRFIEDERKTHNYIKKIFKIKEKNGFYSNQMNPNIMLKLEEKQPQLQKNGFEIYKIDGKYSSEDININFELQIKSLVNVFWGEIDHRILYKNFNYMLTEDFFRDIMSSIKDNLSMIDRQLMLVYDHLDGMDTSNSIAKDIQLKSLLSKIIHDIYVVKVRQELGFVVDFKRSTDIIVEYIFIKGGYEESENYSENFLRILNRLDDIGSKDIVFNKYIDFYKDINFNDDFTKRIGKGILKVINKDFRWNLFFRIIFDIEQGEQVDNFKGFINFVKFRFEKQIMRILEGKNMLEEEKEEIVSCMLDSIAKNFCENLDVEYLFSYSISQLNEKLKKCFIYINSYEEWVENKNDLKVSILNHEI